MIHVDISNIWGELSLSDLLSIEAELSAAHMTVTDRCGAGSEYLGWLDLPDRGPTAELMRILAAAHRIRETSDVLVVIGIGGSYLGARGVIECLCSPNYNLKKKATPNIYFAGNGLSADAMHEIAELLEGVDFSINVISKSGTTTEPAVAFRFFRELAEKKYGKEGAAKRIYATTDNKYVTLTEYLEKAKEKHENTVYYTADVTAQAQYISTPSSVRRLKALICSAKPVSS